VVEWAPDGRQLLALSVEGETVKLTVFDVRSGGSESWDSPGLLQGWRWSPDSTALALQLSGGGLTSSAIHIVRPDGTPISRTDLPKTTERGLLLVPGLLWSEDSRWVAGYRGSDMVLLSRSGDSRRLPLPDGFGQVSVEPIDWTGRGLRITNRRSLPPPAEPGAWLLADAEAGSWERTDLPPRMELTEHLAVEAEFEPEFKLGRTFLTAEGRGRVYAFEELLTTPAGSPPPAIRFVIVRALGVSAQVDAPPDVYGLPASSHISVVLAP
ncbi:MAG: hypothetical protein ACRDHY_03900, partial [Anaerolineales bacterium]